MFKGYVFHKPCAKISWVMKNISFEHKKIKLRNKQYYVEDTTMVSPPQHILNSVNFLVA
jgi:hypothetical protein